MKSGVRSKPVLERPSGAAIRLAMVSRRGSPVTASTTSPSTSVEKPYSQSLPGSNSSGALPIAARYSPFDIFTAAEIELPG